MPTFSGISILSPSHQLKEKVVVNAGPPLTKLSGSAHVHRFRGFMEYCIDPDQLASIKTMFIRYQSTHILLHLGIGGGDRFDRYMYPIICTGDRLEIVRKW